jgi:hypothetical protein
MGTGAVATALDLEEGLAFLEDRLSQPSTARHTP